MTDVSPLIRVGYGNFVPRGRVLSVMSPALAPVQRLVRHARGEGLVIDMSAGRPTRSVAMLDNGGILLLGLTQRELGKRGLPVPPARARRRKRTS